MLKAVLITGISGSGKSVALRTLEDAGYLCVDNLPVRFLRDFIASACAEGLQHVAIAIDARSPGDIAELPEVLHLLRADPALDLRGVFLDAGLATLVHRYSESRRRHPLNDRLVAQIGRQPSLHECITAERELLGPLRELNAVIDTSGLQPRQLRAWVHELVEVEPAQLVLTFSSFAFKNGAPLSADLMFDARCLPNPHYEPELQPLTGRDAPVAQWLEQHALVGQMLDDITHFLRTWLPHYANDTRAYVNIAVGCTGGKHRSVYLIERLAERFANDGAVLVRHRARADDLLEPDRG